MKNLASRAGRCGRMMAGAAVVTIGVGAAAAQDAKTYRLPTPSITIYPGDVIKAEWLTERDVDAMGKPVGRVVTAPEAIVGKIARRTLLPGRAIPLNAVGDPKLIVNGAKVPVLFEQGALSIATYGAALQDGAVGDVISLRNLETGAVVTGVVQADGSVRMHGG
ncbi:flagellar basal body P-ring formation chaperone FlgA [Methylocella sp.]|uniref:flagellar basal body P-ring formation chaperone FlgA n=1 Tax=Methylocella sp. TaxID=1978226 RepID=UPI003782E9EA